MLRRKMKNRIGILGGTFNPIHNGHLLLAQCAIEQYELEKVIFIPNNVSYFKSDIPMPGADIRYEMTRLAIAGHTGFEISDIEIRRSGNSYTYETIGTLTAFYPDSELYFIVGADSVFSFEHWMKPDKISHDCILLAAVRGSTQRTEIISKYHELHARFGTEIKLLDLKRTDISSTEIREHIKSGDWSWCCSLIPADVAEYINSHDLYK